MMRYLAYFVMAVVILECCDAQMTTSTTTTTTPAPSTSVNTSQVVNISVSTGRLLGLLSLFTSLSNRFGGGFVGRCFGAARKLKFIIPFFLYKLGVITTTLGFLTLFTLKGLVIGIILLVLNAGGWLAKLGFAKGYQYGQHSGWGGGYGGHGHMHGWHKSQPPLHIHVHKDRNDHHHDGYISVPPSYSSSSSYDADSSDIGGDMIGGHSLRSSASSSHLYGRGQSIGGSGQDYDPAGGSSGGSWAERISKGLKATRTLAERVELIDLYTRLGFNINDIIGGQLKRSGHSLTYPRKMGVFTTTESSSSIR